MSAASMAAALMRADELIMRKDAKLLNRYPELKVSLKKVKNRVRAVGHLVRSLGRQKIFCVGQNKTGTTSIARALDELGVPVALTIRDNNPKQMEIIEEWRRGDYRRIIRFCQFGQAFQDYPFSLPGTYKVLDNAYPGSKFILSVRDSSEQWCESFVRYYIGKYWYGANPGKGELIQRHPYGSNALKRMRMIYGDWQDPFDRQKLIEAYERHNRDVIDYFKNRPNDLLIVNVSIPEDYLRLCDFLGKQPERVGFPWLNKTG